MTITVVNVGAAAHANAASVVPGLPAGHTTNDILIAFDALRADGTIAATGYTEIGTDGSTSHRLTALKKTDGGSETAPTLAITGNGNSHSAVLAAIRGSSGVVDGTPQTIVSGNSDLTISYPALTINQNGCIVWLFISHNDDLASGSLSFDTPSGFTKLGEWDTQLGADHSLAVYYQIQTTAANIAAGTVTKSGGANATSVAMIFALRAAAGAPPDWTTVPTVTAETAGAYTLSFETTEACTVYAVAVPKDSAVPSIAQVKAGQNGSGTTANGADSKAVAADTADTLTLTIDDATAFPLYDLYAVASNANGDSTRIALPDEFLDPPTGKQFKQFTSAPSVTSPFYGLGVVANDIIVSDLVDDTGDAIEWFDAGDYRIDAAGDVLRRDFAVDVYDCSAFGYRGPGTIYDANLPPTPDEGGAFPEPLLLAYGTAMDDLPLAPYALDPESDTVTVTALGTLAPGLSISSSSLSGTPSVYGPFVTRLRWSDDVGGIYEEDVTQLIGPILDDYEGVTEADAVTALELIASLSTAVDYESSATVGAGRVTRTEPPAGTLVPPDQLVTVFVAFETYEETEAAATGSGSASGVSGTIVAADGVSLGTSSAGSAAFGIISADGVASGSGAVAGDAAYTTGGATVSEATGTASGSGAAFADAEALTIPGPTIVEAEGSIKDTRPPLQQKPGMGVPGWSSTVIGHSEAVTAPGAADVETQPRYTCDGLLSMGNALSDNLEILLTSMVGQAVNSRGKYRVHAGAYEPPVVALGADDLAGAVSLSSDQVRGERYNAVSAMRYDTELGAAVEVVPKTSAEYQAADGGKQSFRDIELLMTLDERRAQRIEQLFLARSREKERLIYRGSLSAYRVGVWDTVAITLPELNIDNEVYRCLERTVHPMAEDGEPAIELVLRKEFASTYADPIPADYGDSTPLLPSAGPDEGLADPISLAYLSLPGAIAFIVTVDWSQVIGPVTFELFESESDSPWSASVLVHSTTASVFTYYREDNAPRYYWVRLRKRGLVSGTAPPESEGLFARAGGMAQGANLILNGDANAGTNYNWTGAIGIGGYYPLVHRADGGFPDNLGPCFSFTGVSGTIVSDQNIRINPNTAYELAAAIRSDDPAGNLHYVGFACFAAGGEPIFHGGCWSYEGSATTLYATASAGQAYVDIVPPSYDWALVTAYPALNFGAGPPWVGSNHLYVPSFSVVNYGAYWRINFNGGAVLAADYAAGTAVCLAQEGGTFNYALWAGEYPTSTWQRRVAIIVGQNGLHVAPLPTQFRRGTAFVRPLILPNYGAVTPRTTYYDGFSLVSLWEKGSTDSRPLVWDPTLRRGSRYWVLTSGAGIPAATYLPGGGQNGDAIRLNASLNLPCFAYTALSADGQLAPAAVEGAVISVRVKFKSVAPPPPYSGSPIIPFVAAVTMNASGGDRVVGPYSGLRVPSGHAHDVWTSGAASVVLRNSGFIGGRHVVLMLGITKNVSDAVIDGVEAEFTGTIFAGPEKPGLVPSSLGAPSNAVLHADGTWRVPGT